MSNTLTILGALVEQVLGCRAADVSRRANTALSDFCGATRAALSHDPGTTVSESSERRHPAAQMWGSEVRIVGRSTDDAAALAGARDTAVAVRAGCLGRTPAEESLDRRAGTLWLVTFDVEPTRQLRAGVPTALRVQVDSSACAGGVSTGTRARGRFRRQDLVRPVPTDVRPRPAMLRFSAISRPNVTRPAGRTARTGPRCAARRPLSASNRRIQLCLDSNPCRPCGRSTCATPAESDFSPVIGGRRASRPGCSCECVRRLLGVLACLIDPSATVSPSSPPAIIAMTLARCARRDPEVSRRDIGESAREATAIVDSPARLW